ncbi:MAG: AAA family ATPase [Dehalococcoidia bacterium]
MINNLSIRNFKSIKGISFTCRRINLFIGGPNTGKSNILEALGILSFGAYHEESLAGFVRVQRVSNLFYDEILDQPVEIEFDNKALLEWTP